MTFVFNDIDNIAAKKEIIPDYRTKKGVVKHFYGNKSSVGGIVSFNGEDFENCKGYPNHWGWGFEDVVLQKRLLLNNIKIDRTNHINIYDNATKNKIHHGSITPTRKIFATVAKLRSNDLMLKYKSDNINDIKELHYDVEDNGTYNNQYIINITNFDTKYLDNEPLLEVNIKAFTDYIRMLKRRRGRPMIFT